MMKSTFLASAAALALIAAAPAAQAPRRAAPTPAAIGGTATYWMSAETASGLAANGMTPGTRPSIMGALTGRGMGRGGGDSYVHTLRLDLGSPRRPAGAPQADHFVPAGLNAGASLPLVSPERGTAPTAPPGPPSGYDPQQMQGRILIYWGCGDHVRPGQPFEIDLSRMARGQVPPAFANPPYRPMSPPNAATSATFGEWPNQRARTTIPANGSLVGAHSIRGNYSPEINFTLAPGQDFLPPIVLTSNTRAATGAVPIGWRPVTGATGYFLTAMGAREDRTMVLWSSSESQFVQMGLLDYLAPDEVARLTQQRVLLPASATQCTVPAEVAGSVQGAMLMMTAFGPEANFSYPERPARPPRGWAPDWTVKLRTRSAYTGLLGMDMDALRRGENPQEQPRRRRNPLGRIFGQ